MAYLSEAKLRSYTRGARYTTEAREFIKSSFQPGATSVFLSHSHLDRELVAGFLRLLASLRVNAYVDWQDKEMARVTSRATAERIKKRIEELDMFLIFATANAMKSRWVPWEIGVADRTKAAGSIFIVPVEDESGRFEGNEYLQLYNALKLDDGDLDTLGAFHPGQREGLLFKGVLREGRYA